MKYSLLVVGNGFDLASGCNTSYDDFLTYEQYSNSQCKLKSFFISAKHRNIFSNTEWNSFEKLLCQYLQFLWYLFNSDNAEGNFTEKYAIDGWTYAYRYYVISVKNISKLPNHILTILMLNNPLERYLQIYSDKDCTKRINHIDDAENIEKLTFRVFINCDVAFASKEYVLRYLLDNLELELESVEKLLNKYIGIVTGKSTSGPITFTEHSTELLISFNYSKIAQKLYGLSDDQVAYIHGNVDSNNVIGVEPSMINEQAFDENTVFIKFFKRFRRIYRDCNCEYNKKITDKLNKDSTIAIFGHSLDLSDKSILKPLFESRYARYDIYCYQDINSYKIKLAKLIGLDLYDELEQDGKIHLIQV